MNSKISALSLLLLVGPACSNTPQNGGDSGPIEDPDGGGPADMGEVPGCEVTHYTWSKSVIDETSMSTGYMPFVRVAPDGRVGVVYLEQAGQMGTCDRVPTNPPIAQWRVRYAESIGGAPFTAETVGQFDSLAITGAALVYDAQSRPTVTYNGGMQAPLRCGGTDVVSATKNGATWTVTTDADLSTGTPAFPADCAGVQGLCDFGMAIGEWIATTMVGTQMAIVYRDMHGGFAQDDLRSADTEFLINGAHTTLDGTGGGGQFSSITTDAMNNIHIASLSDGTRPGIWAFRYDGTAWTRKKIFDIANQTVGYRLSIAASAMRVSVAFHSAKEQKLRFIDSTDNGMTWASPEVVDQTGNTGRTPSMAFNAAGEPSIAYHMCGPYNPNSNDCPQDKDALRFAIKHAGVWCAQDVETNRGGEDGAYVAFAYDAAGVPLIVYQAVFFDPTNGMISRKLKIAKGTR